jgi:hypothetical protein
MATLTVIVGLPGSGKSHYMHQHGASCQGVCAEDYMADSRDNSSELRHSRHHDALIRALRDGKDCMIADIEFCRLEKQDKLTSLIAAHVPGAAITWICFENDPVQSKLNAERRGRADIAAELAKIDELSKVYHVPSNARRLPVWGTVPNT